MKKHMQIKHAPVGVKRVVAVSEEPIMLKAIQFPAPEEITIHNDSEPVQVEVEEQVSLEEIAEIVEDQGPAPIETNWQCGECGKMYNMEEYMRIHMNDVHRQRAQNPNDTEEEPRVETMKSTDKQLETLQNRPCGAPGLPNMRKRPSAVPWALGAAII